MKLPSAAFVGAMCVHRGSRALSAASLRISTRSITASFSTTASSSSTGFIAWDADGRTKLAPLPSSPSDTYVVSSSSRGIGLEFARQLLHRTEGRVVGLARDPATSAGMTELARQYPNRFSSVASDLTDQTSVESAGARVAELTAGGNLSILLNVAGVLGDGKSDKGPERSLKAIDREWLRDSLEVNLVGHVMMTQALLPLLQGNKEQGTWSKVVNLSARVGSIGDNGLGGWHSYRYSKAALNQFTKSAAIELKRRRCITMSMHPGTTDTDLSEPFQKNVATHKLFPVWYSVDRMLEVIWGATDGQSGKFYAYDGSEIPW